MKNLSKSMKWVSIILLFIVSIAIVYSYSKDKGSVLDKMTNYNSSNMMNTNMVENTSTPSIMPEMSTQPTINQPMQSQTMQSASKMSQETGYNMQPVANPEDLLPKDQNSQWANLNPLNGSVPVPVDLLHAGYQIGLDTIGQTLKNANLQLRSDPIIEKKNIGPWMQSTIEPDYGRVPLEIGYGCR